MKKEALILSLVLIAILPLASAEFTCANNTEPTWDAKTIAVGDVRSIKGLTIGVSNADEVSAFSRLIADLLIDTQKVTIANSNITESVNLTQGTYTAKLSRIGIDIEINIDDEKEIIEVGEIGTIKSLSVFLSELNNPDGGEPSAIILVGAQQISLANDGTKYQKVTSGGKSYIVELSTASDNDATIAVYTCDSGEIQEISLSTNITQESNQTANETLNQTEETPIQQEENLTEDNLEENETITQINVTETQTSAKASSLLKNKSLWIIIALIIVISLITLIIFFFMRKSSQSSE